VFSNVLNQFCFIHKDPLCLQAELFDTSQIYYMACAIGTNVNSSSKHW
jgi:hypothetical protein